MLKKNPEIKRKVKIHATQPTGDNGPASPLRPQPQLFRQPGVKAITEKRIARNRKNHFIFFTLQNRILNGLFPNSIVRILLSRASASPMPYARVQRLPNEPSASRGDRGILGAPVPNATGVTSLGSALERIVIRKCS